ncbi:MAG: polymer-forming cytoskeletal protein [Acidovorax sp.]|jgi:cytoskeletal protein CcmA (bactofilin family)|nr:polymer-forming cytoskeletal protein [Acidovorax sp.]
MAVQNPFFGKRDAEAFNTRTTVGSSTLGSGNGNGGGNGYGSASGAGSSASAAVGSSASTVRSTASAATESGGSKLTVGPNIKLKGVEITDCDTLVVEGTVEATMDSRVIQIAEQGAFRGSAEIDIAEIHGKFDGNLTVRDKLVIFSTGQVSGTIRYGKIVIEEGGQLSGDIQVGTGKSAAPASVGGSAPRSASSLSSPAADPAAPQSA